MTATVLPQAERGTCQRSYWVDLTVLNIDVFPSVFRDKKRSAELNSAPHIRWSYWSSFEGLSSILPSCFNCNLCGKNNNYVACSAYIGRRVLKVKSKLKVKWNDWCVSVRLKGDWMPGASRCNQRALCRDSFHVSLTSASSATLALLPSTSLPLLQINSIYIQM